MFSKVFLLFMEICKNIFKIFYNFRWQKNYFWYNIVIMKIMRCTMKKYKFLLFDSLGENNTKKETIPYPICSVVAVFKMLIRILNTLRSRIWDMAVFLFSACWLQKEWIQSSLGGIRGRGQKTTAYSEDVSSRRFCVFFNEQ